MVFEFINAINKKGRNGGGLAIIYKPNLIITKVLLKDCKKWKSFEFLLCKANLKGFILNLVNVYRPPYSTKNKFTISYFFTDFEDFLSAIAPLPGDLLLFGDTSGITNSFKHLQFLQPSKTIFS